MKIRPAVPADLKQCAHLDHDSNTKRVWQMDRREDTARGATTIDFHSARLPRPMRVRYPRDPERLWDDWRNWDCFMVADEDGYIQGYVGLLAYRAEGRAWIRDLVVGRPHRQNGIGTLLLREAVQWATRENLRQVTLEMQSKNHPAIQFCQKHGFQFSGFDESYYPNQDIALFFVSKLR